MLSRRQFLAAALTAGVGAYAGASLTACTSASQGSQSSQSQDSQSPASPDSSTTFTLTDAYGRSVTLSTSTPRAVCVGSAARFAVYAGGASALIAVSDLDKQQSLKRPYTVSHAATFAQLPSVSDGNHLNQTTIDAEAIVSLHPTVIISSRTAAECDALQSQTKIPVVGIRYQGELLSENVYQSIICVGQALGTSECAQRVVNELRTTIANTLQSNYDAVHDCKATAYAAGVNYKGAMGWCGTYAQFPVFDLAGATNVADRSSVTGAFETTLEQLIAWHPNKVFADCANLQLMETEFQTHRSALSVFKDSVYGMPTFNHNGTNVEYGLAAAAYVQSAYSFTSFDNGTDCKNVEDFIAKIFDTLLNADGQHAEESAKLLTQCKAAHMFSRIESMQ